MDFWTILKMKSKILFSSSLCLSGLFLSGLFLSGLWLSGFGLAANADNTDAISRPLPSPSEQQVERALQLGNQFQDMAYQQNRPRTGAPFPLSYIYRPEYYPHYYSAWPYSLRQSSDYYPQYSPHLTPRYPRIGRSYIERPLFNHFPKRHQHND